MQARIGAAALAMGLVLSAAARAEDIKIAVVGPMTGPLASIGEQQKRGAELAAEAINAAGGIGGNKIVLDVEDDQCDPKQAVSVANRIVGNQIKLVAGHACSGSSIPASAVYADAGILMMTPASSNPRLTDEAAAKGWTTIMRLYGRDDTQGKYIGPWIAQHYKGQKIVILHDKGAYGKGLADAVRANMNAAGVKEVLYEGINPGEKDYTALVSQLKSLGAQFVYYGGYHAEAGLILRQSADQGFKFQLMMGDSIATPEFWAIAGPAGEGTMFTFPADPRQRPTAKAVVEQFKKTGFDPEGFTLFSYGVVQAFAEGEKRVGKLDGPAIAKALRAAPVETVLGTVAFDEKGDIKNSEYDINIWHDGKYAKMQ
jgi:branched-chain amino acid transport system substrate-binding protein